MLNIDQILSKICVSRPYFNFDRIEKIGETLIAPIKIEQKHQEGTKLCLGEAMRNMAILGSCAYAINQPEKQYYLATSANGFTNMAEQMDELEAAAKVLNINGNDLVCEVMLWNQNADIVHKTLISYKIFKKSVFEKVFKKSFENFEIDPDNYKKNLVLDITKFDRTLGIAEAEINEITTKNCSGHFENYPIIPVAYLNHHLANMVSQLIEKPVFKSFDAKFLAVAYPNKQVKLFVKRQGNNFLCEAYQDNKIFNSLTLTI